jgi:hypothetical protein
MEPSRRSRSHVRTGSLSLGGSGLVWASKMTLELPEVAGRRRDRRGVWRSLHGVAGPRSNRTTQLLQMAHVASEEADG